jgi:DNA-binding SARP family transcriptional activator
MCTLHVSLFGKFRVEIDGQDLAGLNGRKVQELFCYLLLHRDRSHPREALASLLWGDSLTERSKKYLRHTLWQLQAAIDPRSAPAKDRALLLESDWVQINPEAGLRLDVTAFEQAFEITRGMAGQHLDVRCAQMLQNAVQLYRGDLLEGWYQDWCIYERERLQNMYLTMLDKLIVYCEVRQDYDTGLGYVNCILRYDPAYERAHRYLMRLHYLAGDRTAALRQYERCVNALEHELGVRPTKTTVALYEQIRADHLEHSTPATDGAGTQTEPGLTTVLLAQALDRLRYLDAVLVNTQLQIRQNIQAVELALGEHPLPTELPTQTSGS